MKTTITLALLAFIALETCGQEIQTLFKGAKKFGGYGALTNKFTTIQGNYVNLSGLYGGLYINHHILIGVAASASTNYIPVPQEFSLDPNLRMSYEYGQVGMISEYVLGSNKAVHVVFNLFSGAGFTLQYNRPSSQNPNNYPYQNYGTNDENWFFVIEPGMQAELNLFKWMRLSPGISYRKAYGSYSPGLSDTDLSNTSYSITLKFGKF